MARALDDADARLGRPIRDQVISIRAADATTLQALELVNGELLTRMAVARRAADARRAAARAARACYNAAVAGRNAAPSRFDIDVIAA